MVAGKSRKRHVLPPPGHGVLMVTMVGRISKEENNTYVDKGWCLISNEELN